MKNFSFFLFLIAGTLSLAGCWNSASKNSEAPEHLPVSSESQNQEPVNTPTQVVTEPQKEIPSTELTKEDLNQNSEYFKIRKELQVNNTNGYDLYITNYNQDDCYGLENSLVYSEDLLHMLSTNDKARSILKPKIYTKEYANNLLAQVTKYNNDVLEPPASIFYICHLAEGIDVLSGKYYFDGREEKSQYDTLRGNQKENIMFFFSKGILYPIKKLQLVNTTATGGEVYPCHGTLNTNHMLWTCFTGLDEDPKTNTTFGTYRDTKISLDGRILGTIDRKGE